MSLTSRFASYYAHHGLRATAQRTILALRRALLFNRQIVFYCDLATLSSPQEALPSFLTVERKRSFDELSTQDLHDMIAFWNPKLARRRMDERFTKGASVWLIKSGERLAGYGWTLRGDAIAGYYFPMAENDVQFFDFHVFPKFRGRAIDWFLMTYILHAVAADAGGRAFAEASEWNRASLSSLAMTPFHRLGYVREITCFGHTIVNWSHDSQDRAAAAGSKLGQSYKKSCEDIR
jgi:ribosomal protein S18 acetylase RimI-like enzyme